MDEKMKELIALGVSYALNCQPCLELHKHKAIEVGLTMEEMRAAITVTGKAVRRQPVREYQGREVLP
ncbi:MAG: carboxymuconolactone decarboxylase family protein [Nitrospiraceae bacterium]|nr:carboxymuconolactone decarboxylase family protein [Nitrospiraceae bacterium]